MKRRPPNRTTLSVAIGLLVALWAVSSCSAAKRTADSSHSTDRSFIRKDSMVAMAWKDSLFRDRSISVRLQQTTVTEAVTDSSGRVVVPRSTTITELTAVRNDIENHTKDSAVVSAVRDTVRKDISESYEQTPLPVERNAMWRFFTVFVILGAGAALFFWGRKKRWF